MGENPWFLPRREAVVDSGALEALVNCLEEFDPSVKAARKAAGVGNFWVENGWKMAGK
jgi:hypothetical protein